MPAHRPLSTPRLPAGVLLGLVVIIGLIISPASASTILDEEPIIYEDTGGTLEYSIASAPSRDLSFDRIRVESVELRPIMPYIAITLDTNVNNIDLIEYHEEGEYHITYTAMGQTKPATMHIEYSKNFLGIVTDVRYLIFFDDWDTMGYTGHQYITLSEPLWRGAGDSTDSSSLACVAASSITRRPTPPFIITVASVNEWKNRLLVTDNVLNSYQVDLQRVYDGVTYPSEITILKEGSTVFYQASTSDFSTVYLQSDIDAIKIQVGSEIFQWPLESSGSDIPDSSSVTVYIQNSQTGALLANAHVSILAAAGGTETEIINATLPGGTGVYILQPTGGGSPNPDYYRAIATVPGYSQIIENHSFTLNGPHDVIIEMRPDSGGPLDPERAYLEFYVRDFAANGIPAASIQCGGRILQTNSAGYAVFEVAKNSTHPWIAKKSGYTTIEGTATTGPNPRYVVNVVLGPGTVPTYTQTAGPGETPGGPGATPTPDRRTNEEKGQAVIDMIADNAEGIGALALICLLMGLLKLMVKW